MQQIISKSFCKYILPFAIYSDRSNFPLRLGLGQKILLLLKLSQMATPKNHRRVCSWSRDPSRATCLFYIVYQGCQHISTRLVQLCYHICYIQIEKQRYRGQPNLKGGHPMAFFPIWLFFFNFNKNINFSGLWFFLFQFNQTIINTAH